jgi:hypothetical protein
LISSSATAGKVPVVRVEQKNEENTPIDFPVVQ